MKKLKRPVALNAKIYNDLVKVFNDASCNPNLKLVRSEIIELRKKFPTYAELKESGIKFVDQPVFEYEDGTVGEIRTWVGSFENPEDARTTSIFDADIVYGIGFINDINPETSEKIVALKIRGVPKGQ